MVQEMEMWDQEVIMDAPCPSSEDISRFVELFRPAQREDGRIYNGYIQMHQKVSQENEEGNLTQTMKWCWGYPQKAIEELCHSPKLNAHDTYITFNAMKNPLNRQMQDVFALCNIVIDVDWHGLDPADAQILARAFADLIKDGMVTAVQPNMLVHTGRGLQVWYSIKQLPVIAKWRYDLVREELVKIYRDFLSRDPLFEGYEVDNLKANGLVRLPWSYNSKARTYAIPEFIHSQKHNWWDQNWWDRYNIDKAARVVQIDRAVAMKPKKMVNAGTVAYIKKRMDILAKLREIRRDQVCEDRDLYLYMVYCSVIKAVGEDDVAMKYVYDFNDGFYAPLDESTIISFLSTAREKKYPVSNGWIIDNMGVSDEECRLIGLERKDKKGDKEKAAINRAERERIKKEIIRMANDGIPRKEISEKLGCSLKHISVVLKEYREKENVTKIANNMSAVDVGEGNLDSLKGLVVAVSSAGEDVTKFANKMSVVDGEEGVTISLEDVVSAVSCAGKDVTEFANNRGLDGGVLSFTVLDNYITFSG